MAPPSPKALSPWWEQVRLSSITDWRKHSFASVDKCKLSRRLFDAPLGKLDGTFTPSLSPIASGDFASLVDWNGRTPVTDTIKQTIAAQVKQAHDAGLMTRYWNTPLYPNFARKAVWGAVLEQGSDLLNADNLKAASEF
jgi:hypothetical protein